VDVIGPRPRRDVDDRAGVPAVLGAERRVVDLNSDTVLIDGWNVIWFCTMSFRFTPLIMKLTVSSRLPAVLNANDPWPRSGAVRKPLCGGVTDPGMSRPRSTKWRPFSGISWTVRCSITVPTDVVAVSMIGDVPVTATVSAMGPTLSLKFTDSVRATSTSTSCVWSVKPSRCART